MAAAAAAYQQQSWQQAPDVDHAALAGHTSRQHQTSHSSRTVLWRAGGSKALAEQQHQQLGQGGLLRSSLAAQPSAGQQGHSSSTWTEAAAHSRQQQQQHWQQPVMWGVQPPSFHDGNAGQQGCIGWEEQSLGKAPRLYRQEDAGHAGQPCSSPPRPPGVKLIKPERGEETVIKGLSVVAGGISTGIQDVELHTPWQGWQLVVQLGRVIMTAVLSETHFIQILLAVTCTANHPAVCACVLFHCCSVTAAATAAVIASAPQQHG
jgi:hypothetical protein